MSVTAAKGANELDGPGKVNKVSKISISLQGLRTSIASDQAAGLSSGDADSSVEARHHVRRSGIE